LPLIAVQHHHAHIAACMGEHSISGPVIGLSLDGTGYGTDGRIWGGEVLIAQLDGPDPGKFERFAHFDYVPMPGGEAAIHEPWRMVLGHLHAAGFDIESEEICGLLNVKQHDAHLIRRMIERGINTPLTSSCGRLFDAVAAVVLGRSTVDYEAQAAIELEGIATDEPDAIADAYPFETVAGNPMKDDPWRFSAAPMWRALWADLRAGVSKAQISARFHAGLAVWFRREAILVSGLKGIEQVVLSGGCMHNRRLARLLREGLEDAGFTVFQHVQVSPGDGGLSYGQAVIAAAMLARKRGER
jgi:hydrogenase maturation protein HypF